MTISLVLRNQQQQCISIRKKEKEKETNPREQKKKFLCGIGTGGLMEQKE
jgi:hypothetical protein